MKPIQTGIERLYANPPRQLAGKRLGLLANPASVDRHFRHSRLLVAERYPDQLKALFSPQHGFFAEKQDNMVLSDHRIDRALDIPIFSLYGETREPSESMFRTIDTLLVDLQDVGTRVYTFVYTMALCMKAAAVYDKEVVVLDRPNPLGGVMVEGNLVEENLTSFVGMYPIPMRHGLTIGELACMVKGQFGLDCHLNIIEMSGWRRYMTFQQTGLPWIPPSPNLPTPTAAQVYPGQVIWEGTNVSEGRGTTQPFEVFGAPFFDPEGIAAALEERDLSGIHLRPVAFEPTANKWQGLLCHGFQLHVLDPERYHPYRTSLAILKAVFDLYPNRFEWKQPPYEFEYEKLPFDLITGDHRVRKEAIEGRPTANTLERLQKDWEADLWAFDESRKEFLLYR